MTVSVEFKDVPIDGKFTTPEAKVSYTKSSNDDSDDNATAPNSKGGVTKALFYSYERVIYPASEHNER